MEIRDYLEDGDSWYLVKPANFKVEDIKYTELVEKDFDTLNAKFTITYRIVD